VNLVLCHPGDAAAAWLAHALRSRGVAIDVVTVEELVYSRRIVFRQDARGDGGSVTLHDGRVLRPEAIGVLINRVRYLPTAHFAAAAPEERAYAESELSALLLGWLNAIPGRVVNPAHPCSLGGDALAPMRVSHAAAMAGLPTRPWQASSEIAHARVADADVQQRIRAAHVAIVFDGRLYGSLLPRSLQDGVRKLALLLGLPLLEVALDRAADGAWRFVGATGDVAFRRGGAALVRALASVMTTRAAA